MHNVENTKRTFVGSGFRNSTPFLTFSCTISELGKAISVKITHPLTIFPRGMEGGGGGMKTPLTGTY